MIVTYSQPLVSILMATYDGAAFLGEQLDSILAQTWPNWTLTVSDDGSTDGTWELLRHYQAEHSGRIKVVRGPNRGWCANFMALTRNADQGADYYAWSDQDDIWQPGKLAMALEKMRPYGQSEAVLYCGRDLLVDRDNKEYGLAPALRLPPSFRNALVEPALLGHNEVLNKAAWQQVVCGLGPGKVTFGHDWWAYLIVSGTGGHVVYDPRPTMRYRVHGGNVSQRRPGLRTWLARLGDALACRHMDARHASWAALSECSNLLTPENRESLRLLLRLAQRKSGPLGRLLSVWEAGLYRQKRLETIALYAIALLGRL